MTSRTQRQENIGHPYDDFHVHFCLLLKRNRNIHGDVVVVLPMSHCEMAIRREGNWHVVELKIEMMEYNNDNKSSNALE